MFLSLMGCWRGALGANKPGNGGPHEVPGRVFQPQGQCLRPAVQSRDIDAVWPGFGIASDPVSATPEQGRGSDIVPTQGMGEPDGKLCEPLPEVALVDGSCLPGGLEDLMGMEGTAFVQQALSFAQALVRRKDKLVRHARNSGVSTRKRPAKRITGPGIARATELVAFSVDSHGVVASTGSAAGTPSASSRTKPPSSRIFTPSCCALSAFDPAFSPSTT
jgi:hypothetical protein